MVERLACALLSNARGVWRCLCLEAPYMSTICTSEFLKALEVFLHTHANLCRGREQRGAKRTAHARRGSATVPPLAHLGPPLSAFWGGAKRGFRRKPGMEQENKPSVLDPGGFSSEPQRAVSSLSPAPHIRFSLPSLTRS